jgi:hypothetical protein
MRGGVDDENGVEVDFCFCFITHLFFDLVLFGPLTGRKKPANIYYVKKMYQNENLSENILAIVLI